MSRTDEPGRGSRGPTWLNTYRRGSWHSEGSERHRRRRTLLREVVDFGRRLRQGGYRRHRVLLGLFARRRVLRRWAGLGGVAQRTELALLSSNITCRASERAT